MGSRGGQGWVAVQASAGGALIRRRSECGYITAAAGRRSARRVSCQVASKRHGEASRDREVCQNGTIGGSDPEVRGSIGGKRPGSRAVQANQAQSNPINVNQTEEFHRQVKAIADSEDAPAHSLAPQPVHWRHSTEMPLWSRTYGCGATLRLTLRLFVD
jgi:hypothetical protein